MAGLPGAPADPSVSDVRREGGTRPRVGSASRSGTLRGGRPEVVILLAAFGLGLVLFLALLGLAEIVEMTSSAESAGRAVSGSARTTSAT